MDERHIVEAETPPGGESSGAATGGDGIGATPSSGGSSGKGTGGLSGNGGSSISGAGGDDTPSGGTPSGGSAGADGGTSVGAGMAGSGGRGAGGMMNPSGGMAGASGSSGTGGASTRFSFFVTSLSAMRVVSGNQNGFGGDLRYGRATGLEGADEICRTIAGDSMPGAELKEWRAFLSTVAGPLHAIDRIGPGPWYDRQGRLVAQNAAGLLYDRPMGADPNIVNDLPNERGVPNHQDGAPGCTGNACPDNQYVLTGTGPDGRLYSTMPSSTCGDWTSAVGIMEAGPWCGFSWARGTMGPWMSAAPAGGCAPGVHLQETGGPQPGDYTVGAGGGYGAIYCFALTP